MALTLLNVIVRHQCRSVETFIHLFHYYTWYCLSYNTILTQW